MKYAPYIVYILLNYAPYSIILAIFALKTKSSWKRKSFKKSSCGNKISFKT